MGNAGKIRYADLPPLEESTSERMRRELGMSLILAVLYFIFIFGVPILNWTAPGFMKTRIFGGMPVTWFLTAIMALFLAWFFAFVHAWWYTAAILKEDASENKGKGPGINA
jgi:uncharacterized membrane protein (DUF485 family)